MRGAKRAPGIGALGRPGTFEAGLSGRIAGANSSPAQGSLEFVQVRVLGLRYWTMLRITRSRADIGQRDLVELLKEAPRRTPPTHAASRVATVGTPLAGSKSGVSGAPKSREVRGVASSPYRRHCEKSCASQMGAALPVVRKAAGQTLLQPDEDGDHCTLDESYNFQVTLPHLQWHMPRARELADAGRPM